MHVPQKAPPSHGWIDRAVIAGPGCGREKYCERDEDEGDGEGEADQKGYAPVWVRSLTLEGFVFQRVQRKRKKRN